MKGKMKSTPRRASVGAQVFGATLRVMAVWVVLAGGGQPAYATHFRYGHINWAPVSGTTIQFTIQNSFRRSVGPPEAYECIDPATVAPGTVTTIPAQPQMAYPGRGMDSVR